MELKQLYSNSKFQPLLPDWTPSTRHTRFVILRTNQSVETLKKRSCTASCYTRHGPAWKPKLYKRILTEKIDYLDQCVSHKYSCCPVDIYEVRNNFNRNLLRHLTSVPKICTQYRLSTKLDLEKMFTWQQSATGLLLPLRVIMPMFLSVFGVLQNHVWTCAWYLTIRLVTQNHPLGIEKGILIFSTGWSALAFGPKISAKGEQISRENHWYI